MKPGAPAPEQGPSRRGPRGERARGALAQERTRVWGLALPPSTAQAPLPWHRREQGLVSRMLWACGWHLPATRPPLGQSVVPKSPVTGAHRPGRMENPSFAMAAAEGGHRARVSSTKPLRYFGKVKGHAGLAAGHPGTAGTGAWALVDALPSQAGTAAPLPAFAHTGIFLRSSN